MQQLDCRNWLCPKPVIEARKLLLAAPAAPLCVLVEDEVAIQNLERLATALGRPLRRLIVAGVPALEFAAAAPAVAAATTAAGKTVVFVTGETLGDGDEELGRLLLRNFLITLVELERTPEAIFFINAGVKLTVHGAETVEVLAKLADLGVDIAACGLCLEFYKLKGTHAVGRITNMLDIVQSLAAADRVLRP